LFDALGQAVYLSPLKKENSVEIDVSSLASGFYFLHIQFKTQSLSRKILIV
jgi:hypothetical protein